MRIIGGIHKGRKLFADTDKKTRPSLGKLRETLFNICQNTIEGAHFLDLFAGVGAIGLEALSRGAAKATFVENDSVAKRMIQKNIAHLDEQKRARLSAVDVFEALLNFAEKRRQFDIIFADPPYGKGFSDKILQFVDSHALLTPEGELFIEDTHFGEVELNHLQLKSSRKAGRAHLNQYIRN